MLPNMEELLECDNEDAVTTEKQVDYSEENVVTERECPEEVRT